MYILYKLSCSIYAIWIGYIFCVVQVNEIKRWLNFVCFKQADIRIKLLFAFIWWCIVACVWLPYGCIYRMIYVCDTRFQFIYSINFSAWAFSNWAWGSLSNNTHTYICFFLLFAIFFTLWLVYIDYCRYCLFLAKILEVESSRMVSYWKWIALLAENKAKHHIQHIKIMCCKQQQKNSNNKICKYKKNTAYSRCTKLKFTYILISECWDRTEFLHFAE